MKAIRSAIDEGLTPDAQSPDPQVTTAKEKGTR
jgi:hypothetical protein